MGTVADDLAAKNPTWGLKEIIENLGGEVRTRLRLSGGIPPSTDAPPSPPAFAPGSHARSGPGGPTLGRVESEIAELIADL